MKLITLILVAAMLAFTAGFSDCGKNKDGSAKTPEQIGQERVAQLATGVSVAARGIETGIDTVRALREAGKVTPQTSLALARKARVANAADGEIAKYLLDHEQIGESDRATILDEASKILDAARDLESFTVSKNGNAQLVFDLSVTAGKSGLQIASDEFGSSLPPGFKITITPDVRAKLQSAQQVIARNEQRLGEAITNLERITRDAPPDARQ